MNRIIVLMLSIAVLSGCKLAVVVVEGGEVQSVSSGTCHPITSGISGRVCIHEVTNTSYTESFTAVPDTGWEFVKWNSGGNFFCEDSTNPTCSLSNVGTAGVAAIEAIIASENTYYIMPIFRELTIPVADTVVVDGKQWAQLDLFVNLSWNEINAVCPQANAGVCDGVLSHLAGDYNMTGWTWANTADLISVMENHYGAVATGTEIYAPGGPDIPWAAQFLSDFRATEVGAVGGSGYQEVAGWLRNEDQFGQGKHWTVHDETSAAGSDDFASSGVNAKHYRTFGRGAFFYRALP